MTDTLNAVELHSRARDKNAPAPQEFRTATDRLVKAERNRAIAIAERDDLIIAARRIGVPWVALARWTGLSERRLFEIVEDR